MPNIFMEKRKILRTTNKLSKLARIDTEKVDDVAFLKRRVKGNVSHATNAQILQIDMNVGENMQKLERMGVKLDNKKGFVIPQHVTNAQLGEIQRAIRNISVLIGQKEGLKKLILKDEKGQ